jgi:outer membrane receptor for ferrienterochelin and colicin
MKSGTASVFKTAKASMFGGAAMLALLPNLAMAQSAPADDMADEGEAIVVTGSRPIAESEAAALQIQKNSDSLVAVIASDSVGRLPDQNIAQAAGRLPGVAVERDQGQARYISLRGAPNYWTTSSAPKAVTHAMTASRRRSRRKSLSPKR